jgi:hypothetical protein
MMILGPSTEIPLSYFIYSSFSVIIQITPLARVDIMVVQGRSPPEVVEKMKRHPTTQAQHTTTMMSFCSPQNIVKVIYGKAEQRLLINCCEGEREIYRQKKKEREREKSGQKKKDSLFL